MHPETEPKRRLGFIILHASKKFLLISQQLFSNEEMNGCFFIQDKSLFVELRYKGLSHWLDFLKFC